MSNLVHPNTILACVDAGGAVIRQYLWYIDTSLANSNAARVAVAAQIAAGTVPTGYVGASPGPLLQLAPGTWTFPQEIWAFVVAESTTGGFAMSGDVVNKQAGDGW